MGHVGLLPQYAKNFKTRGKKKNERFYEKKKKF